MSSNERLAILAEIESEYPCIAEGAEHYLSMYIDAERRREGKNSRPTPKTDAEKFASFWNISVADAQNLMEDGRHEV